MTLRMQANTHPDIPIGYHEVEHDATDSCDTHPRCLPALPDRPNNVADWQIPPGHYTSRSGMQPWDVWDEFDLDRYTANAVKYILRAGKKDIAPRLDDLKKAANYIAKAIDMEENRERPPSS